MVSKKILGVAIAAAFASQGAFATIDLSADTGAVKFAKEAVLASNVTNGYTTLTGAGNIFDVTAKYGSGVSTGGHGYIRIDLVNAKFATAVVAGDLTAANTSAKSVQQGGQVGDSYVVFDVTSSGMAQTDVFTLAIGSLSVSTTADANIKYTMYDQAAAANNGSTSNILAATQTYNPSTGQANPIAWVNAFSSTFTASNAVASVNNSFTDYASPLAGSQGKLGSVKFTLDTAALKPNGVAVAAYADVIDPTKKVKIAGDLSFGTWGITTSATCAAPTAFADDAAITGTVLDTLLISNFTANSTYNVCNDNTVAAAINESSYTISYEAPALSGAAMGPAASNGNAVGSITRDGTSIYIPYLTTFADYTQRIVLVNRGSTAAPYKITFTPEAGVTATGTSLATGSLAAGKTLVLKTADVVTLTGGSRTAATVVVTAQTANIDAATTIVNATDKSTDTVKLK